VSSTDARVLRVVAAVIERGGRYLITQRRKAAVLPLLWEFPGGRVHEEETDEQAVVREVRYRLGVAVKVGTHISSVRHPYEHYTVDLHLYACELLSGVLVAQNVETFIWATSSELDGYDFAPADEASMSKLLGIN